MSTFTVNISNTFLVLGMSPATRWDEASWDESLWNNKEIIPMLVTKGIKSTFAVSTDIGKNITRKIDSTFAISTDINHAIRKKIDDGFSVDSEMNSVVKKSGYWAKIYPGGTSNILESTSTSYTAISASETTYTQVVASSTSWTEV